MDKVLDLYKKLKNDKKLNKEHYIGNLVILDNENFTYSLKIIVYRKDEIRLMFKDIETFLNELKGYTEFLDIDLIKIFGGIND